MKFILFLLLTNQILSMDLPLENTAFLLEKGQKEIGICHPLRLGRTDKTEFSIHPILGFVIPNFKMKSKLSSSENLENAYFLKLTYPTPLLKMVQKKGIGGLIAEDPNFKPIPHLLVSELGVISTKIMKEKYYVSAFGSMAFTTGIGVVDERITIDLPYFYPRMSMYNSDYTLISGLNFTGPLWRNIGFDFGASMRYTFGSDQSLAFEIRDNLFWQFKPNMKLLLGYDLYFAEYPFGNQWDLIPTIDLRYKW